jgi:hypothetical protein
MHSTELLLLIFLGLLIWFWLDSARAKEVASSAGSRACGHGQVSFLDETVEITKLRLKRDTDGRMRLQREYRFEFSSDGSRRYQGRITMLGHRVAALSMDAYRENSSGPE